MTTLSVVVPVHQAGRYLADTLGALRGSDLPKSAWELIVVDDASRDDSAAIAAQFADRVVALSGRPSGPARARNAGAAGAKGEWLVFIDADVRVHPDTLSRFARVAENPEAPAAVFGAYDATPAASGIVSRYRNLLHRYVHLRGAGPAATFWAGCGAVRRAEFEAAGGFDAVRYSRPAIEDIELGYRLTARGATILLDPAIQGTHLKAWTLRGVVKTDLFDRGIPWMRLLLERRGAEGRDLNVGGGEPAKVALTALGLGAAAVAVFYWSVKPLLVTTAAYALVAAWNAPFYRWAAEQQGPAFAAAITPLHLLHYTCNVIAAAAGAGYFAWSRLRRPSASERRR